MSGETPGELLLRVHPNISDDQVRLCWSASSARRSVPSGVASSFGYRSFERTSLEQDMADDSNDADLPSEAFDRLQQ